MLLVCCTFFLFRIEQHISSIPRFSSTYTAEDRERPDHMTDHLWNAPLVFIKGGEVSVEGEVSINQPNYFPIPVKLIK